MDNLSELNFTYRKRLSILNETFQDTIAHGEKYNCIVLFRLIISNNSNTLLPLFRLCKRLSKWGGRDAGVLKKLLFKILMMRYNHICDRFNVYLPYTTEIGKGLQFPHSFPITINPASSIGKYCIIHPCVLIGRDRGKNGAPIIGDYVFIGHGSKIIGCPHIGNYVFIAPGAIVTKDIPTGATVGAGVNNIIGYSGLSHVKLYLSNTAKSVLEKDITEETK